MLFDCVVVVMLKCFLLNSEYIIGSKIRVSRVENSKLKIMVIVIGVCIFVFLLNLIVMGSRFRIVVSVVMMMGCNWWFVVLIIVLCLF